MSPARSPHPSDHLCVVRGGGDLATGVVWRLLHSGFGVLVTELAQPLTVRRSVAVSAAVSDGFVIIEGMTARLVETPVVLPGEVAVVVSPGLPGIEASVVVDARMAKRNLDTTMHDAPLVVGLGPGFVPGENCHAAIETMRGHTLGRALWDRSPAANTGAPGRVAGRDSERVLRSPADGKIHWYVRIGDVVTDGAALGEVAGSVVHAPFAGLVRGLIAEGIDVPRNLKIGDIDPRDPDLTNWREISDKALAVGGGVLEAVMTWLTSPPSISLTASPTASPLSVTVPR